jgi:hypothetical protein
MLPCLIAAMLSFVDDAIADSLKRYADCKGVLAAIRLMKEEAGTARGREEILIRLKRDARIKSLPISVDGFVFLRGRPGVLEKDEPFAELSKRVADALLDDDLLTPMLLDTFVYLPDRYGKEYSEMMGAMVPGLWDLRNEANSAKNPDWHRKFYVERDYRLGLVPHMIEIGKPDEDIVDSILFWELLGRPIAKKGLGRDNFNKWQVQLLRWWNDHKRNLIYEAKTNRVRRGSTSELAKLKKELERLNRDHEDWAKNANEPQLPLVAPSRLGPRQIDQSLVWIWAKPYPPSLGNLRNW